MDNYQEYISSLYRELGPCLLGYFRKQPMLSPMAEDLLQDTFIRALRQPGRLKSSISPKAYLFGIARHVGLDASRRSRLPIQELGDHPAETPAAGDPRLDNMRKAIAALPETHREPLMLKLHQELSYEEIAEILNIPVGTVRSRLHHAVRQLRETLLQP